VNAAETRGILVPAREHAGIRDRIRHLSADVWVGKIILRLADAQAEGIETEGCCGVRVIALDTPTHTGERFLSVHRAGCATYAEIEAETRDDAAEADAMARYYAGEVRS